MRWNLCVIGNSFHSTIKNISRGQKSQSKFALFVSPMTILVIVICEATRHLLLGLSNNVLDF
jgi:hypothetical protein